MSNGIQTKKALRMKMIQSRSEENKNYNQQKKTVKQICRSKKKDPNKHSVKSIE